MSAWGSRDIGDVISQALGYSRLIPYVEETNVSVYRAIFYVLLALLLFLVLDAAYVSYIYSNKKSSFTWPIHILRILVMMVTTIFFLPTFEYFVSFVGCVKDSSGKSVLALFSEVECGTGLHLANSVLAIVAAVILVSITIISTLTLFEGRNIPNSPNSRYFCHVFY